jgi:hypothetical protein
MSKENSSQLISNRSKLTSISFADKEQIELKPAYFIYPFFNEPLYDFDIKELTENE